MLGFVLECVIWTLAIYGFIDILKIIINYTKNRRIESNGIFVIVAVKNQELQIEGFLRTSIFKMLYNKENYIKQILITDLNSVDSTKQILEKISNDYDEIKLINWEDCKKQLDNLE